MSRDIANEPDLRAARQLDLAALDLNFERFRALCQNPNLSNNERIGFPDSYRDGFESAIFADIQSKLPALTKREQTIIDIGPGCANLPRMLIEFCAAQQHRLLLVDSREMLDYLPNEPHVVKIEGSFPRNIDAIRDAVRGSTTAILCYSVLHYMFADTNLYDVVDGMMTLLAPGGAALIGDIPNASKRRRFFASPNGVAFHKAFMKTDQVAEVVFNTVQPGAIDDAVLAGVVQRCQLAGCDAYVVPQAPDLPMANRRDDFLIRRP